MFLNINNYIVLNKTNNIKIQSKTMQNYTVKTNIHYSCLSEKNHLKYQYKTKEILQETSTCLIIAADLYLIPKCKVFQARSGLIFEHISGDTSYTYTK